MISVKAPSVYQTAPPPAAPWARAAGAGEAAGTIDAAIRRMYDSSMKTQSSPKRMRSYRVSDDADALLQAIAAKLSEDSGGAVAYTKTDALEMAVRALARQQKVTVEPKK